MTGNAIFFKQDVKRQPKKIFLNTGVSLTMKRERGINNHNGYENITPSFRPFCFVYLYSLSVEG